MGAAVTERNDISSESMKDLNVAFKFEKISFTPLSGSNYYLEIDSLIKV